MITQAVDAFARLVERDPGGTPATREVAVTAADRPGLLVELLNELVYLAESAGFVSDDVRIDIEGTTLRARLEGRLTAVDHLVKAATYHDLRFEQRGSTWYACVVLDV